MAPRSISASPSFRTMTFDNLASISTMPAACNHAQLVSVVRVCLDNHADSTPASSPGAQNPTTAAGMATLQRRRCPRILADAGTIVMLLLLELPSPALSLVVNGTIFKGCSRDCESRHCQDPFKLRYGKYCGIGYTGCESEVPCDGIDSCCKSHDICIGADLENYVNRTCNDQLKRCVEKFQDSNMTQFNGSACSATEIEEVIITSMNIATIGKSVGTPSSSPNIRSITALVYNSFMVLLLGGW